MKAPARFSMTLKFALTLTAMAVSVIAQAQVIPGTACMADKDINKSALLTPGYKERPAEIFSTFWQENRLCGIIKVPVTVERTECVGLNNLGFAMGASNLVGGKFSNTQNKTFRDLMETYVGRARGMGVIAGYGSWQASSSKQVSVGDKRMALPLPIPGGDLAIGATDCQYSFKLTPMGNAFIYNKDVHGNPAEVSFEAIADVAL